MDKEAKDKLVGSPGENGGGQDAQKGLHARTGRDETKRKTQERMERRSGKRSSCAGSEKMERVGDKTKFRDIVRQAKAYNGLQRQWTKRKKVVHAHFCNVCNFLLNMWSILRVECQFQFSFELHCMDVGRVLIGKNVWWEGEVWYGELSVEGVVMLRCQDGVKDLVGKYCLSLSIKHCSVYITLFRAQSEDGCIRGAETCCDNYLLIVINKKFVLDSEFIYRVAQNNVYTL